MKPQTIVTREERLCPEKICVIHRKRPYFLLVEIDPEDEVDLFKNCAVCGRRITRTWQRHLRFVFHLIQKEDGSCLSAESRFGRTIVEKAKKKASAWICQRRECDSRRFDNPDELWRS